MNAATLQKENNTIGKIEKRYLKNKFGQTYIACEDLDFHWTKEEVFDFECMWYEGKTLLEIAEYFNRPDMEILLLAADRADLGRIKPREGGLLGVLNK